MRAPAAPRTCVVCGCDDDNACMTPEGPCGWLNDAQDICTACANWIDDLCRAYGFTGKDVAMIAAIALSRPAGPHAILMEVR